MVLLYYQTVGHVAIAVIKSTVSMLLFRCATLVKGYHLPEQCSTDQANSKPFVPRNYPVDNNVGRHRWYQSNKIGPRK